MNDLEISAHDGSPTLHVHVNPIHALYHYLAREGQRPHAERNPATAHAASLMARARYPRAVQGHWSA